MHLRVHLLLLEQLLLLLLMRMLHVMLLRSERGPKLHVFCNRRLLLVHDASASAVFLVVRAAVETEQLAEKVREPSRVRRSLAFSARSDRSWCEDVLHGVG